ncbi:ATP-dependent Clp protease adapter ClpS [Brachybacterium endophyticum]|uniref:ATP-dependent Clp protease adapter ClpS n=1 Tax=Brachybacterium endophyticum TaxID=2182385 RepID=UPI001F0C93DF|nr:ATP-dependent Clp protease adapter ClpS [Brachybacterium endophyticum]
MDDGPWQTVVWNDPVNLQSYVVHVFRTYFGFSRSRAHQLMIQVHEQGRAVVSRGSRERVESDVQAMHSFGLRATLERTEED